MLTSTPITTKPSDQTSRRTIAKRNKFLVNMFKSTSGDSNQAFEAQTSSFVKSLDEEQRQNILKEANITSAKISEDMMVAMKVDMRVPWEKLKTMSRYRFLKYIEKKYFR